VSHSSSEPPRGLAWLLGRVLGAEEAEVRLGDLQEELDRAGGSASALLWYWCQALTILAHEVRTRASRHRAGGTIPDRARLVGSELAQTARSLRRAPGFTLTVVATTALAVGSVTAIYSLVHAVLVAPLPYEEGERLVRLREIDTSQEGRRDFVSPPNYLDWVAGSRSIAVAGAWWSPFVTLTGDGEPERVLATLASHQLFDVLRVRPALGRPYGPEEDRPGGPPAVLLSDGFWRRRFGADPGVLGRSLVLDGRPCDIVGVMPPGFAFPAPGVELWVALQLREREEATLGTPYRGLRILEVVARLSDGFSEEEAREELASIARRLEKAYPDTNSGWGVEVVGLREDSAGRHRAGLLALFGASGLVLLIACANISSLVLARSQGRARAVAVRAALGASRWRLVRSMLAESALLAALGGVAGTALGLSAVRLLALRPLELPGLEGVGHDPRVLLFAIAATAGSAALFGLLPALRATRGDLSGRLRFGASGPSAARNDARLRRTLVVGEVAVALALLVGAGLLTRSVAALLDVDPGFRAEGVAVVGGLDLPRSYFEDPVQTASLQEQLLERIRHTPGVDAAGLSLGIPLAPDADFFVAQTPFELPGLERRDSRRRPTAPLHVVSPGFFDALRIPLTRGRPFDSRDRRGRAPVAIVNEAFVRRHLAGVEPIGRRLVHELLLTEGESGEREIVGVVGDVRHFDLDEEPPPQIYLPSLQTPWPRMHVVVRGRGDAAALGNVVRRAVAELLPDVPASPAVPLARIAEGAVAQPRFRAELLALFGALALTLSAVGLAGMQASSVAARIREIGVRVALGARAGQVVRMVVLEGVALTAVGVALGLAAALAGSGILAGMLFGVEPLDRLTWLAAPALLLSVALVACWIPARRAARVDPLRAIRAE
jgi:putative ABC transport system permease protein